MVDGSIVELVFGLVVEVLLVWADGLQQLQDVVGVQRAGLRGHAAGQVCVADVGHSLLTTTHTHTHVYNAANTTSHTQLLVS